MRVLRHLQQATSPDPADQVFLDAHGMPLLPWAVSRRFTALVARAGLPAIRLHDVRHTSATLGLAAGESLKAVSARLGHADIAVTAAIYAHVPDQVARRDALRLAGRLNPGRAEQ